MKPKKNTTCLWLLILLCTLAFANLPKTATAQVTEIEWLSLWTEPEELMYWSLITQAYQAETGNTVTMTNVEADELFTTIMIRHATGEDPDIISSHAMWLPAFANWKVNMLTAPPDDIVADIEGNYSSPAVDGSTYKGIVWGYPTEVNSHAMVYYKKLIVEEIAARNAAGEYENAAKLENALLKLESNNPLTYAEIKECAILLTKRDEFGVINQAGFMPYINGAEEMRFEFMNFLWSNNGEYLDLYAPEAKFNSPEGVEVLQLFHDLDDNVNPGAGSYDPDVLPDVYWAGWMPDVNETAVLVVLPTWFTYVRDAMGDGFYTDLGVAPVPIGPHGTPETTTSVVYNWLSVVTKKAENEGRSGTAWDFLRWLNQPRPAGYLSDPDLGIIPRESNVSIMGDFLIYDSIVPSRMWDQDYGRVWEEPTPGAPETSAGSLISDDFWFKAFMDIGRDYGRAPDYFTKSVEVQNEVAAMFEGVTILGNDPQTAADNAANAVNPLLPMPGDINLDGPVDIYDAVHLVGDIDATPEWGPNWYVGRSDVNDNDVVDLADSVILATNYGRTGAPL